MALNPNELFSSTSVDALKRVDAITVQPKKFAAGTGTLATLTPVAFDTVALTWKLWANAGTNGVNVVKGFVWSDAIVLDSDEEVLGNVLLQGKIHYADVVLPDGETDANLKAALQGTQRDLGIIIQGLTEVR